MIAKGFTIAETARAIGMGARQVERWNSPTKSTVPGFRQRVEQLREERPEPGADEMLRAALSATKRDGTPDWPVVIAAAKALKMTPPDPAALTPEAYQVTIHFNRDKDGNPIFGPVDADGNEIPLRDGGEVIDAQAVEVPGHGLLPAGPPIPQ